MLAILLFAAPASADPAAAERAFHRGTEAYARGDFATAAASFEEAFHADPRAVTIYNAGLARQLAGDSAHAADDYAAALLLSDLTAAQGGDTRTRLTALEASLGRLDVVATGAVVSVGPDDKLPSPAHVHLAPGTYDVRAAWPDGGSATRSITVAAGAEQTVTLDKPAAPPPLPSASVPSTSAPPVPPATGSSTLAGTLERPPPPASSPPSRTLLYVSGAVGIVGLGLGAVAGILALGDKSTIDQHCGLGGVRTQAGLLSTIGFTVGAVGIAAAIVLLVTQDHEPAPATGRGWEPLIASDGAHGAVAGARGTW
jgi:hypothetical protein